MKLILGGGISGLSAAHYLLNKNPRESIVLLEATSRVGGWMSSSILPDGTIFEQGPRTIRPKGVAGANTLGLIEELGLAELIKPIGSNEPAAKVRMIYADGELHVLPSSISSLFRKQKFVSKPLVTYFMQEPFKAAKLLEDESIYSFAERRFGREISDYLISPMICGICAGNAKEISVKFLMASLFEKEQKYGSVTAGLLRGLINGEFKSTKTTGLAERALKEKWNVYSFEGGIEVLPKALKQSNETRGVDMKFDTECKELHFKNEVSVGLSDGSFLQAEHLISSIPAEKLSKLLKVQHPTLSSLLGNIKAVSTAVINLKYDKKILNTEAFGFLVCPNENLPILGVIYDSCCFPHQTDQTILTVMMGGHWFQQHFGEKPKEEDLLNIALKEINQILKIDITPVKHKVNILKDCIPQYKVGHEKNLKHINNYIKEHKLKLSLCGSSYYGVGVNDVILSARKAVEELN